MKSVIALAALAMTAVAVPQAAEARGCLKGAVVGGIAGHFAGRHATVGALGGCLVGRHLANRRDRERQTYGRRVDPRSNTGYAYR